MFLNVNLYNQELNFKQFQQLLSYYKFCIDVRTDQEFRNLQFWADLEVPKWYSAQQSILFYEKKDLAVILKDNLWEVAILYGKLFLYMISNNHLSIGYISLVKLEFLKPKLEHYTMRTSQHCLKRHKK